MDALKELFTTVLLPDRKLRCGAVDVSCVCLGNSVAVWLRMFAVPVFKCTSELWL